MTSQFDRRRRCLVQSAALLAGGVWQSAAAAPSQSAGGRLNIGVIGAGGRGIDNIAAMAGENIAALCDVDERRLGPVASRHRKAKTYRDFRKLLDQPDLDAAVVCTPNHTHAVAAIAAMRRGLHVYCEKPLAHNVRETQKMAEVARQTKVATQMGNQHHGSAGYRRAVQIIRSGVLGAVRRVHAWTVRPIWPQGIDRPAETPPAPGALDWDLWLGPAPRRPYHSAYHPRLWRGWWDFGGGALADYVPHILDPVYEGLQLTAPARISATSSPVSDQTAPKWSILEFQFPNRGELPPVHVTWYDGGKRPPPEATGFPRLPPNGALLLGEHGKLFVPELGKMPTAVANEQGERLDLPEAPPAPEQSHWQEWLAGCKSGGRTSSDFAYGACLTEVALLGNIALRVGEAVEWDATAGRFTSAPAANKLLGRENRDGWKLE